LKKFAVSLVVTIALSVLIAGSTAATAAAYGNTAVYQIAFSGNCDDPSNFLCANVFGVGGIWVWAELDQGGTGDATVAHCAHDLSTAPHGGAFGSPTEITWRTITWAGPPMAIGAVNQDPNKTYLVISTPFGPLPTVPATPGHYSFSAGPAVQAQTQVTLIPGR